MSLTTCADISAVFELHKEQFSFGGVFEFVYNFIYLENHINSENYVKSEILSLALTTCVFSTVKEINK